MGVKIKPQNPKTLRTHWSRAFPWPGTYEAPPSPPGSSHVDAYQSRAGSRPGPMTSVISPEAVVPGASPGPMAILARDLCPVFY